MMRMTVIGCGLILLVGQIVAAQDMALTQVLMDGQEWELVSEGHKFTEGPAVDADGNVYFTDVPASKIFKIDTATNQVTVFAENAEKPSGLMFGTGGRLFACQSGAARIVTYNPDGSVTVLAENIPCNDLVTTSQGGVYVTDAKNLQVWFIPPEGKPQVVASGFKPNGITLWGDEGTLVVTDGDQPHLWTFRVKADGTLDSQDRYYLPLRLVPGNDKPGSDGIAMDADGRLYVATHAGLQMFDPTGRMGGVILKPQSAFLSNVEFGGPEGHYLYVTTADKVYRRLVKPKGLPAIPGPAKTSG